MILSYLTYGVVFLLYFFIFFFDHGMLFVNEEFLLFLSLCTMFFVIFSVGRRMFARELLSYIVTLKHYLSLNIQSYISVFARRKEDYFLRFNVCSASALWSNSLFGYSEDQEESQALSYENFYHDDFAFTVLDASSNFVYSEVFFSESFFSVCGYTVLEELALFDENNLNLGTINRFKKHLTDFDQYHVGK